MELHRYFYEVREANLTLSIAPLCYQQQHYLLDIEYSFLSKAITCFILHKPPHQYNSFQISAIPASGQTRRLPGQNK
jgi:hypothetical protein